MRVHGKWELVTSPVNPSQNRFLTNLSTKSGVTRDEDKRQEVKAFIHSYLESAKNNDHDSINGVVWTGMISFGMIIISYKLTLLIISNI